MKKLLILLFTIISYTSFAQVKVGSEGNIVPTGNYPAIKSGDIKGTLHSFTTIVERNAMSLNYRDIGMLAYVSDSSKYYTLQGGVSNASWVELKTNGGKAGIDSIYFSAGLNTDSVIYTISGNNYLAGIIDKQQGLISGGVIKYVSGATYSVSPAIYRLGRMRYNTTQQNVTLDALSNRIDRIVADTFNNVVIIKGVAALNPVTPAYDPQSQVPLGTINLTLGFGGGTIINSVGVKRVFERNDSLFYEPGYINDDNPIYEYFIAKINRSGTDSSAYHGMIQFNDSTILMTRPNGLYDTLQVQGTGDGGDGAGTTYTASNGLTMNGNDIKLGGTLTGPTVITGSSAITFENTATNGVGLFVKGVNGWGTFSYGDHYGIVGVSNSGGIGGQFTTASTGTAYLPALEAVVSDTVSNAVATTFNLGRHTPSGLKRDGIGQKIDFHTANYYANSIISSLYNIPTPTSKFLVTGLYNNITDTVLSLDGTGKVSFFKYGAGTFTGTPTYNLSVDANGNIIETANPTGGGGTYTASNGLTMNGNNVQLGGILTKHDTLSMGAYGVRMIGSKSDLVGYDALLKIFNSSGTGVSGASSTATGVYGIGSLGVVGESSNGIAITGQTTNGTPGKFTETSSSLYNSVKSVLSIDRRGSNTLNVTNGFGLSVDMYLLSPNNNLISTGKIVNVFTDTTNSLETANLSFHSLYKGVLTKQFELQGNNTQFYGTIQLKGYTVATLPTGVIGMTAYVTDASSPTFGAILVGGGSTVAKAFYNGTNWINE